MTSCLATSSLVTSCLATSCLATFCLVTSCLVNLEGCCFWGDLKNEGPFWQGHHRGSVFHSSAPPFPHTRAALVHTHCGGCTVSREGNRGNRSGGRGHLSQDGCRRDPTRSQIWRKKVSGYEWVFLHGWFFFLFPHLLVIADSKLVRLSVKVKVS